VSVQQKKQSINGRGEPTAPAFTEIVIERELRGVRVIESQSIGTVGGSVPGVDGDGRPNGPIVYRAVRWEGNTLVFETETRADSTGTRTWTERREAWSFDDTGRLQVAVTNRSSDGPRRSKTMIYRRR
jgi:hypothetical protein